MAAEEINTDSPRGRAILLLNILKHDLEEHLLTVDAYLQGDHPDPYMPEMADDEYKLLAKRAIDNKVPLLVRAPVQGCYVDGFRAGRQAAGKSDHATEIVNDPSWDHWQRSRLDARQTAIYLAAVAYGHSFTVTEIGDDGKTYTRGLSPLRTSAIYDDPASDEDPVAAIHVSRWPTAKRPGKARFWDGPIEYEVSFTDDYDKLRLEEVGDTGADECPVTRFAIEVDLDGRTHGIVEEIIPLQDRLNQTAFDLLIAQTYGSFKVRTVTGMAPPMVQKPIFDEDGHVIGFEPELDDNGQPKPLRVQVNGKQMLYAEDPEVEFGTLDETPLDGYISALKDVSERLSAATQTPPTYLLGQIANLSAEALNAAETTFNRKVGQYQHAFGEAWERVFRLAARLEGDTARAEDFHGEVVWRDMESRSMAQDADALGKLAQNLGIPARGLWPRVRGVTQAELTRWEELAEEGDAELQMAEALTRASGGRSTRSIPQPTRSGAQDAA
ncbi:phage portal protein [Puerhibacterium puerhi]|uniref:phage portal protein n=1 Tax=Puerhibacterium puerhi TaxID=2692623 RepID=UPI00191555CE|nr:phage portal protein [Puerhibacterium puerhi]